MNTYSEMVAGAQLDLNKGAESTFITPASVGSYLARAYLKAYGLFLWPESEDAKKTSSVADQEYYDYPQTWIPDSIWKLKYNSVDLKDPLVFKDYLYEKENSYPNGNKRIWSSQWRRFFITYDGASPTSNGNNNIEVWGKKAADTFNSDNPLTIFSYSLPECNIAVVDEAVAMMKSKGDNDQGGAFKSAEALKTLTVAYSKIKASQSKYEKTTPLLDVPDLFEDNNSRTKTNIGDFS